MKSSIILLNTRLRRTVTILRFKLLDTITVCFEKSVLYFGMGEPLTSACKKCLSSIPIPFRTLCWLCFVQSLVCPYFGILAENPFPRERGYITGAAALTPLGATPKARMLWLLAKSFARCKTSRASNAKRPFLIMIEVFRQSAGGASLYSVIT